MGKRSQKTIPQCIYLWMVEVWNLWEIFTSFYASVISKLCTTNVQYDKKFNF